MKVFVLLFVSIFGIEVDLPVSISLMKAETIFRNACLMFDLESIAFTSNFA